MNEIILNTDNLKRAVGKLAHSYNSKVLLPALLHVHCSVSGNEIKMTTSDIELTGEITIEADSNSESSSEFLIPFAELVQISKVLTSQEITICVGEKSVKIQSGFDEYELKSNSELGEFTLPKFETLDNCIELGRQEVSNLKSVSTLLSADSFKLFKGLALLEVVGNKFTVVSTDATALIRLKSECEGNRLDARIMLSEKVIKSLEDIGMPTSLRYSETMTCLEQLNYKLYASRSTATFPNYKAIIPNKEPNITINRAQLIEALTKCSLISGELKQASLSVEDGEMLVNAGHENSGIAIKTKVVLEQSGDNVVRSAYTLHLLKVLHEAKCEQVSLALYADSSSIVVTSPTDENYLSLVALIV